jgi:hypothetical protein
MTPNMYVSDPTLMWNLCDDKAFPPPFSFLAILDHERQHWPCVEANLKKIPTSVGCLLMLQIYSLFSGRPRELDIMTLLL